MRPTGTKITAVHGVVKILDQAAPNAPKTPSANTLHLRKALTPHPAGGISLLPAPPSGNPGRPRGLGETT